MSITFPTIIEVDDYREFQTGNNSPINDNDIQSAINTTFIQLNGICNNQIMLRWDLTSGEDMLNDTQKNLIQQAFLLQTKYNLDYDNDTSEGSVQSSFGANTYSSTRPRRDKITQDILNLLNRAGVYSQVTVSSVTRSPLSRMGGYSSQWNPLFDSYVTYEAADSRYVWQNWGTQYAGQYLYINSNGKVATTTAVGGTTIWGRIGGTIENQTDLINYLQTNYYTAQECDNKYFLESEGVAMDLRLEAVEDDLPNKVTKSTIDNKQLLYARENGTEKTIVYGATTDLGSGTIPTRVAGGNLRVPDSPTNDNDAICKKVNNLDNYYTKTESDNKYQLKITLTNKLDYSLLDNKPTIASLLETITGYDATKNQTLRNLSGTFTWVSDAETPWYEDDTYIASLTSADVGTEKEVMVNGVSHTVRLIGIDHDTIAGTSNKAHTTWEFVDLISDENGYSLATLWQDTATQSGSNYDYLNSSIRKALDGQGSGTANWFEKGSETWSTTYANKSVLSMLPANLQSKLKTVSKIVNENTSESWVETTYSTNLFLATPKEMGYDSSYMESGVTTYDYYTSSTSQTDVKRIKAQVQGSTGALTSETSISGTAFSSGTSYAGYNSSTAGRGGYYWLRSPYTNNTGFAWDVYEAGLVYHSYVFNLAFGVAPCFCL